MGLGVLLFSIGSIRNLPIEHESKMSTRFEWELALKQVSLKSGRSTSSRLDSPGVWRPGRRNARSPPGIQRKTSGPLGDPARPNWTTILLIALLLFIYAHCWWNCLVNGALQDDSSAHSQEDKTQEGSQRSPHKPQKPSTSDQSNGRTRSSASSSATARDQLPLGKFSLRAGQRSICILATTGSQAARLPRSGGQVPREEPTR